MTQEQSNKIALLKELNKVPKYLTINTIEDIVIDGIIYQTKEHLIDEVELKGYNLKKGYLVTIKETNALELMAGLTMYKKGYTLLHFESPLVLKGNIINIERNLIWKS